MSFIEDVSETYVYAGYSNDTHFFIHFISNMRDFQQEISKYVYHALVNSNKIRSRDKNVVIYQIHPVSEITHLIVIQNYDKDPSKRVRFDREYMERYFGEIMSLDRKTNNTGEGAFIVKYDYDKRVYKMNRTMDTFEEMMRYVVEDYTGKLRIHEVIDYYLIKEMNE
jgi:hypothetical protein